MSHAVCYWKCSQICNFNKKWFIWVLSLSWKLTVFFICRKQLNSYTAALKKKKTNVKNKTNNKQTKQTVKNKRKNKRFTDRWWQETSLYAAFSPALHQSLLRNFPSIFLYTQHHSFLWVYERHLIIDTKDSYKNSDLHSHKHWHEGDWHQGNLYIPSQVSTQV